MNCSTMNNFLSQQGGCTRYIYALLKQHAFNSTDTILLMSCTNIAVTVSVHSNDMSYSAPLCWYSAVCVDIVVQGLLM